MMTPSTIIGILILFAIVVLIIRRMIKNRKNGKCHCCSACPSCNEAEYDEKRHRGIAIWVSKLSTCDGCLRYSKETYK